MLRMNVKVWIFRTLIVDSVVLEHCVLRMNVKVSIFRTLNVDSVVLEHYVLSLNVKLTNWGSCIWL